MNGKEKAKYLKDIDNLRSASDRYEDILDDYADLQSRLNFCIDALKLISTWAIYDCTCDTIRIRALDTLKIVKHD